jgi:hypothetical protein
MFLYGRLSFIYTSRHVIARYEFLVADWWACLKTGWSERKPQQDGNFQPLDKSALCSVIVV